MQSFDPHSSYKNGPGAWEHFVPKRQSPHNLVWACDLAWECLFLFRLNVCFFVLVKCMSYGTWPAPLMYLSPAGRGQVPLFCSTSRVCEGHWFCVGFWEGAAGHGRPMAATKADLALSHLYVTFFHQCTVLCFFWQLQYHEVVGRSIWTSPGDRQPMPLAGQICPPLLVHTGLCWVDACCSV